MPIYEWKPAYSVKVKRCDDDHRRLFALICDLRAALKSGKGEKAVDTVVAELESYSVVHFAAEEALLEETDYPGLEPHRMEHRRFTDNLATFRKRGISRQPYEILNFMNDWLVHHIKHTDQKYSSHLNAHGIH